MRLVSRALDLLFLPGCASCDTLIASDAALCPACAVSLVEITRPAPPPPPLAALSAPYLYGGELAVALRRLKFDGRRDVARALAPLLADPLAAAAAGCDLLVVVPLHPRRLARRRFNQAALLLEHSRRRAPAAARIAVDHLSLRRVRATAPQTGLDRAERQGNVDGAFAVAPRRRARVAGRTILLFDDVATTGATLAAAGDALLAAGAAAVRAFAAARADPGA